MNFFFLKNSLNFEQLISLKRINYNLLCAIFKIFFRPFNWYLKNDTVSIIDIINQDEKNDKNQPFFFQLNEQLDRINVKFAE